MRANLSVVARRNEPLDSLDYFPTPPWATRAFLEDVLLARGWLLPDHVVEEPACGEGHMAAVLAEYCQTVRASDIFPYGFGAVRDYLDQWFEAPMCDWTITNPPFKVADAFILRALQLSRRGVAVLVRTSFLEGKERYRTLFETNPPTLVAQYVERVPMCKGKWDPELSSATSYCWLVWCSFAAPQPLTWIKPGARQRFAGADDIQRFVPKAQVPLFDGEVAA